MKIKILVIAVVMEVDLFMLAHSVEHTSMLHVIKQPFFLILLVIVGTEMTSFSLLNCAWRSLSGPIYKLSLQLHTLRTGQLLIL